MRVLITAVTARTGRLHEHDCKVLINSSSREVAQFLVIFWQVYDLCSVHQLCGLSPLRLVLLCG